MTKQRSSKLSSEDSNYQWEYRKISPSSTVCGLELEEDPRHYGQDLNAAADSWQVYQQKDLCNYADTPNTALFLY